MKLLYVCQDYVVAEKPVGLSSEDGENSFPALLRQQLGGEIFPIHRLDLNVGGVMVYARTKQAAAKLSSLVQGGELVKEYRAMVHGRPENDGDWEDLLFKDSRKNKVFVVQKERKGVKKARLTYHVIEGGEISQVHIRLYTGRTHQIRVQFSSRGFPLVGDHKYGARDNEKMPMLFCCKLSFPWNGETKIYEKLPSWAE